MSNSIIYFTNKIDNVKDTSIVIKPMVEAANYLHKFFTAQLHKLGEEVFDKMPRLALDMEATALDPYYANPLILIIGSDKMTIEIDLRNKEAALKVLEVLRLFSKSIIFVGANIKYDYKLLKAHYNITLENVIDIMVNEQRLTQNMPYSYALDKIITRYLGTVPDWMNKLIREDFINADPTAFIMENKHIFYAGADVEELLNIANLQDKRLDKFNMTSFIQKVETPLISILAEIELKGFRFDKEAWRTLLKKNIQTRYEIELKLDNEVRRLRSLHAPVHLKKLIVGGKYDKKRNPPLNLHNDVDIFGEVIKYKKSKAKTVYPYINYNSTDEIIRLFGVFEQPLCTKKYQILDINLVLEKVGSKMKVFSKTKESFEGEEGFTTKESELEQYMILNPHSIMIDFIKLLMEFRKYNTRINTFGDKFFEYINKVTGKIHTVYRQCAEDKTSDAKDSQQRSPINGRLSSGNTRQGFYNAQNLPRENDFRHCFLADSDFKIVTCDLRGAEVTTMADKANDSNLLKLTGQDIHSHMATKGWRRIFLYRAGKLVTYRDFKGKVRKLWENDIEFQSHFYKARYIQTIEKAALKNNEIKELYDLSQNYIVSKKINKPVRVTAKNLTFGGVYGCKAGKAARTINVSKEEGQIYLLAQKAEMPDTYNYVENNVELALNQGYLTIDTRSNTRIWFPDIVDVIKQNRAIKKYNATNTHKKAYMNVTYDMKKIVDGQARNIPISGTQANMLKESMVVFDKHIKNNSLDIQLLGQVHDELIVHVHNKYLQDTPILYYKNKLIGGGDLVSKIMNDTSNLYLKNFKMESEYEIAPYWLK